MHAKKFRQNFLLVVMVCALVAGGTPSVGAQSQAGTGQIVGTVYDSQGALVTGAKVTATNKATNLSREGTTGDEGQYRFILLPPGMYSVTFTAQGFKTHKAEVEVTVGATATVNATLAVGEVSQVIEVAATPAVETTVATEDALINDKAIVNLPINGRRFQDFVTLTPTVQIEAQRNGISFAGQRGINGNVTIDGADYNEPFFGGIRGGERSNNSFTIPQESISQFQVVSYGYSVEFGRSTGGLLNAVTKSGTNEFHGSVFYYNRNRELGKRDAFNFKALSSLNQVGGSFGGPVVKDKTFFFGAAEYQQNDTPRSVFFSNLDRLVLTTPLSTAQMEAFCFYRSTTGCPSGSGQENSFTQTNDGFTVLGKVDQQFGVNHRASVRYHYGTSEGVNAVATGDSLQPTTNRALTNNGTEKDNTHNVTGQWTAVWSPTVVGETRITYTKENRPRLSNTTLPQVSNGIGTTGAREFLPTTASNYRVQVASNLNWTLGKHTLKFGGEYNHLFADQFFQFNQFGRFIVSGSASTDGGVRTILGIIGANPAGNVNRFNSTAVTYLLNIGNGLLDMTQEEVAFFVEDTWRITPRLTITPGLRWEGYFNPQPDVSNSALYNSVRNFGFPIGRTVDPAGIPDNTDQVMPRLGIAWDPWGDSKTVIRANAGLYYARIPLLLFAGPLNNFRTPAGDLSVALPFRLASGAGISNCGQLGLTPLFTGDNCNTVYAQLRRIGIDLNNSSLGNLPQLTPAQLTQIATALGLAVDPNRGAQPIAMANNFEAPHSFQWGVGIEREVSRGWSVGADYVYVNTIHLQRNTDYNLPTPLICTGAPLPAGCTSADLSLRPCFGIAGSSACNGRARPIATLGSVQIRESNSRALYQGFTLRSNFRRGRYNFQSYYTLSYNNSDDDNERDAGGQGAANAFALQQEYGRSRLDVRHLVLVNGVVDLPAGFQVGALGRWRSSRPIDPTTGGDTNGDNFSTDRAFQAIGIPFERNSFRDRAVFDTDLRVSWNAFRLLSKLRPNENSRLLVTADIFNLFNYDNVVYTSGASGGSNRNYGVGVSTAGAIVPANASFQRLRVATACSSNPNCYDTNNSTARIYNFQVQFGVRFEF